MLYKQALAIDPRYAPAWDGLAGTTSTRRAYALRSSDEGYGWRARRPKRRLRSTPNTRRRRRLGRIARATSRPSSGGRPLPARAGARSAAFRSFGNAAVLAQSLGRVDQAIGSWNTWSPAIR